MPNPQLAAGFITLADVFKERVNTQGVNVLFDAVRESAEYHTQRLNEIFSPLVRVETMAKERRMMANGGTLQPLDRHGHGSPDPVRVSGYYEVAFPIFGGGRAWGTNRISRAKMTIEQANRNTLEAQKADANWMRRHMLAAVFTNTTYTYEDHDDEIGTLTIQPLANQDGTLFELKDGTTVDADHYLAQSNGIDDANNPFPGIYDKLTRYIDSGDEVVCYIPQNLQNDIESLSNFVPVADPDITLGNASDTIRLSTERADAIRGAGNEVLGKVDGCWIVLFRELPDNYIIGFEIGGGPVITQREFEESELRGFFPEEENINGNFRQLNMIRYAGFGAHRRTGALVQRIGNASYAIPSGFDAPLSI